MYWHLSLEITPLFCRPSMRSIVISEDPLEWERRMYQHRSVQAPHITMKQYREIPSVLYECHHDRNPVGPGSPDDRYDPPQCRDFLMHERDYAQKVSV
jgi:hypothetical protein